MAAMAALFIGIFLSLAPTIGGTIESAAPVPAGSSWNATENPDLPTGGGWFADYFVWVGLTFLGLSAGVVIRVLMGW